MNSRAFTLVELLIVLVVIAILMTMALPSLLSSRLTANESAAHATMRQIVQSQMAFVNRKEADLNNDGTGEYGTFGEMSGNVAVRFASGGTKFLEPSVISRSFRAISPLGEMLRGGYYYRLYLPRSDGTALIEKPGGGADENVDPTLAATFWCCYAWPQKRHQTGGRTFFANQSGDIVYTDSDIHSGPGAPITAGAAFVEGGPANSMTGVVASGVTGRDGNLWKSVSR